MYRIHKHTNKKKKMNTTGDWADLDENEDVELPQPEVIEDEKAGTKTVIEYRLENGNKVKVTTKYKVSTKVKKVSKKVGSISFLS
jgi:hypothetical protein